MALNPNHWTDTVIEVPIDQDDWTEVLGSMAIRAGYYKAPNQGSTKGRSAAGDDSILIEKTQTLTNQYGSKIRQDDESWQYDVVNGPPLQYDRETLWSGYLPGIGRGLRKVEEEKIVYWTFTPFTDGDNLGRTRFLSAFVVYTLPVDPTKNTSAEGQDKTEEKGMVAGAKQDRIVESGKLWSEANLGSNIVEEAGAPQVTKWVKNVIVEHDIVEEQADRWIVWTVIKNSLRPQGIEVKGPRDIKKTGFVYQFPYPVGAPKMTVSNRSTGINVEVKGGGATILNPYFGPSGKVEVPADKYNIYRKKTSEPARTGDPDLYDWWDVDPPLPEERKIIGNAVVEDFAGTPTSALPAQSSYTEPGDSDPPDEPYETAFELIATVTNENVERRTDHGYAEYFDQDVVNTAEYEYYATAVIAEAESPDSNHETITYSGPENHHHRISLLDDGKGAEASVPEDPEIPDTDYGEVEEFDLPLDNDEGILEEAMEEIAARQFAQNEPDFTIQMDVLMPLLGLEYGQTVELPTIEWDTWANDLHMEQETESDDWMLVGFTLKGERTPAGAWKTQRTVLNLRERTTR